jgi:hypothetical protein
MTDHRIGSRTVPPRVQQATIYRDREDLSYADAVDRVTRSEPLDVVFNIVAVVRDVSSGGVGVTFEGQDIMGLNLIDEGERYILRLQLNTLEPPPILAPVLLNDEPGVSVVAKVVCRWRRLSERTSSAGFELTDDTPTVIREYLQGRAASETPRT